MFTKSSLCATIRIEKEVMTNAFDTEVYKTSTGKEPYTEWAESLDKNALVRIDARITRIEKTGNFGICESVGDGVFELKLDFGPGYRIYFGYKTDTVLVLLMVVIKKDNKKI